MIEVWGTAMKRAEWFITRYAETFKLDPSQGLGGVNPQIMLGIMADNILYKDNCYEALLR